MPAAVRFGAPSIDRQQRHVRPQGGNLGLVALEGHGVAGMEEARTRDLDAVAEEPMKAFGVTFQRLVRGPCRA